jgi:ABC-type enterochelin transport system ATPase subunit
MLSAKEFHDGIYSANTYNNLKKKFRDFEVRYVGVQNKETVYQVLIDAENSQYVLWDAPIKNLDRTVNVIKNVYPVLRSAFFTKNDKKKFPKDTGNV